MLAKSLGGPYLALLQRSAEDARRDAKQWAAQSGEADPTADATDFVTAEGEEGDESLWGLYRPDNIGNATRLIDVLRSTMGTNQITTGSSEVRLIVQKLCEFGQVALGSPEDLLATVVRERATRTIKTLGRVPADADVPGQDKVKSINSQ